MDRSVHHLPTSFHSSSRRRGNPLSGSALRLRHEARPTVLPEPLLRPPPWWAPPPTPCGLLQIEAWGGASVPFGAFFKHSGGIVRWPAAVLLMTSRPLGTGVVQHALADGLPDGLL